MRTTTSQADTASALHRALAAVDVCRLPVLSRDRCLPRKEQATMARKLFKQLGLKGISVTTPNYSMAHVVDIRMPRLPAELHDRTRWPHTHGDCCRDPNGHSEATRCPQCAAEAKANGAIEEILSRAFPRHDDRSDIQTDHFDDCWSID
jgi:hypothetical protein